MLIGQAIEDRSEYAFSYMELMKDIFEAKCCPEKSFDRFKAWMESTDFFTAPASTRFHGSYTGGLLKHHIDTYNQAINLLELDKFKDVNIYSAALCALTHDFCKIGLYEKYLKNVKNDETGKWEKQEAFKWDSVQYPFGHGVTSMYLAQQFIRFTREEALAVRWHMGEYNVCANEMSELQEARDRYPLVLLLQTADRLAVTSY